MTREKLIKLSKNLISDKENYMNAFHKNMNLYVSQPDMTIREISERSGLSFSTINTVLYGNNHDYKLSTIIGLSKAMNVSIDELVGCSTMNEEERYLLQQYRSSSPRLQLLILWFVKLHTKIWNSEASANPNSISISIMQLALDSQGEIIPSEQYIQHTVSISIHELKAPIILGLQLPCCDYMPYYSPYDYLLIANDREPHLNEDCIILSCGKLYIARRIISDRPSAIECVQINTGRLFEPAPDEILGYVTCTITDNNYYQR